MNIGLIKKDWDKLVDNKELIKQLVEQNKWDEVTNLSKLQKRYDVIAKYNAAEKTVFGFAKGFMNVIDTPEGLWNSILRNYFINKFPEIHILDYKTFFKEKKGSYSYYGSAGTRTYVDEEDKLSKIDINSGIYLMNICTSTGQRHYINKVRKMKSDYGMDINMFSTHTTNLNKFQLLTMKDIRLYQHIKYDVWNEEIKYNSHIFQPDYIIN